MTLHIAPGLDLADDFATEGVVVMGVRGSGKSNTEVRFAELLHAAGIPFVAVDPKGDWFGVRMEGSGPGLPIPVFGGLYGDFPLDERLGARIADLLVDENLSAVLDVSKLSKTSARPAFLVAFFNQLMERHQDEPHVRCVILEEAHSYIPQTVTAKTAVLKEAAASILLEGRAFGLGCWACTQRPARLHNDVLEECDTAIIHRIGVTATADLKRVRDWVKHEDLGEEIAVSLTKLANGEAWVLSPASLGIVQRVRVGRRTTFDSGATPTVGVSKRRLSTMADIDAAAIKEALAETIEKAKADDPRELHKRIRALEQQIATAPEPVIERVEVPVPFVPPSLMRAVKVMTEHLAQTESLNQRVAMALRTGAEEWEEAEHQASKLPEEAKQGGRAAASPVGRAQSPGTSTREAGRSGVASAAPGSAGTLGGGAPRRILVALAQYGELSQGRAAALVGITQKKSTLRNALSALRKAGFIDGSDLLRITQAGYNELGDDFEPLPTGDALLAHWRNELGDGAPRQIFDVLIEAWPDTVDTDTVCTRTDIDATKSTYRNAMSRLRTLGLVVDNRLNPDIAEAIR